MSKVDTGFVQLLYTTIKSSNALSLTDLRNVLFSSSTFTDGFLNSDTFKNDVMTLSSFFDFNRDGTLDAKDIQFFRDNCSNVGFMINLVNSGICAGNTLVNSFSTANFTKSDLINIGMKIIIYAVFLPLVSSNNFMNWANGHDLDSSRTNLDTLFDVLNMIFDFINSSQLVANVAGKLASKLLDSGCCCSKKTDPDTVAKNNFAISTSGLQTAVDLHTTKKTLSN